MDCTSPACHQLSHCILCVVVLLCCNHELGKYYFEFLLPYMEYDDDLHGDSDDNVDHHAAARGIIPRTYCDRSRDSSSLPAHCYPLVDKYYAARPGVEARSLRNSKGSIKFCWKVTAQNASLIFSSPLHVGCVI